MTKETSDLVRLLDVACTNLELYANAYAKELKLPDRSDAVKSLANDVAGLELGTSVDTGTTVNVPKDYAEFRNTFLGVVRTVRAESTKLGVIFTSGGRPRVSDIQTMAGLFIKALLCLMECTYAQQTQSVSVLCKDTLAHVKRSTNNILNSGVSFFQTLRDVCKAGDSEQIPPQATAIVWSACDEALETFPARNSDAVCAMLRVIDELLQDAVEELNGEYTQAKEEASQAFDEGCNPSSTNASDADSDDEYDVQDDIWSAVELDTASATLGLCKATDKAVKTVRDRFVIYCENVGFEGVMYLDAISNVSQGLSELVDDLVICMYPPQVPATLLENAAHLEDQVQRLLTLAQKEVDGVSLDVSKKGVQACDIVSKALTYNLENIRKTNV